MTTPSLDRKYIIIGILKIEKGFRPWFIYHTKRRVFFLVLYSAIKKSIIHIIQTLNRFIAMNPSNTLRKLFGHINNLNIF